MSYSSSTRRIFEFDFELTKSSSKSSSLSSFKYHNIQLKLLTSLIEFYYFINFKLHLYHLYMNYLKNPKSLIKFKFIRA